MSLTSIIKSDKVLRDKISSAFLRPKLDKTQPILAESLTNHPNIIGIAFDYIFRFYLEKLNTIQNESKKWISELGIESFGPNEKNYSEVGLEIINDVKKLKKEFIRTGKLSQDLIRQTVRMSYIDPVYRSGIGIEYIGKDADKSDIEDIEKQFYCIEEKLFFAEDICLLNPEFGEATGIVSGADADFLIDDKLIDIKTTKKLEFRLVDFCQIISYLLLSKIGGIEDRKEAEINQLGIYYSRYGYLFMFNIKDLIENDSLHAVASWFDNYIRERSLHNL